LLYSLNSDRALPIGNKGNGALAQATQLKFVGRSLVSLICRAAAASSVPVEVLGLTHPDLPKIVEADVERRRQEIEGESLSKPTSSVGSVKKRRTRSGGDGGGKSLSQAQSRPVHVEKVGQQAGGDGGESSSGEDEDEEQEDVMEKGFKMSRICDRLIEVFLNERTTPTEWRSLLAMSAEWERIRPHFYKHCKAKAKAETVVKSKRELNRLAKHIQEVCISSSTVLLSLVDTKL
jgi:hypothetical protein